MPRVHRLPGLLVFCVLLLVRPAEGQSDRDAHARAEREAQAAATEWLTLVEDGDFEDSWEAAAAPFRERIEEEQWEERGERLRDSLRARSRRTRSMVQYRDSLRDISGGPFVILTYRSSFEGGRVEEVLVTVREDATWKVTGYQVTPLLPDSAQTAASSN